MERRWADNRVAFQQKASSEEREGDARAGGIATAYITILSFHRNLRKNPELRVIAGLKADSDGCKEGERPTKKKRKSYMGR